MSTFAIQEMRYLTLSLGDHAVITMWDFVRQEACSLRTHLRLSAVRNMVAVGIPDVVCMKISGHKSRSVFDRYNVVSMSDVAEATQKLENRKLQVKMELAPKLAPAIEKQNRKSLKTA